MNRSRSPIAIGTAIAGLAAALLFTWTAPAGAGDFDVTNTDDSGPGSLRQAILDAEAAPGADTITIQAGLGTIVSSSELSWSLNGPLTIQGNGATIDFSGAALGLEDAGGFGVNISGLTITGVTGSSSSDAAPLVSQGGGVTAVDCAFLGNDVTTDDGDVAGAILSEGGGITVGTCIIDGNSGTTTDGNAAGGIESEGGGITVRDSEITCNTATASDDAGGAIYSGGGGVTVSNSTVDGNQATSTGGGLSDNAILSDGGGVSTPGSTIGDDTSICAEEPPPPPVEPPPAAAPAAVTPSFTG